LKIQSPSRVSATLLILIASIPACGPQPGIKGANENTHATTPNNRRMFGVELRPQAAALLAEIEEHYRKQVRAESKDKLEHSYYAGIASVDTGGTPVIELSNYAPPTEERIVHELFHLKLYAEDFPVIRIEYPSNWREGSRKQAHVRYLVSQIYDTIEHWIFYPRMREMGISPDEVLKRNVELDLEEDPASAERIAGVPERDYLTIYYFKAAVLLSDENLFERLTDLYSRKRWYEPLAVGRIMADRVTASKPASPDEAISVLLRCLEVIQRDSNSFEITKRETEQRGDHTLRRLYLKVVPQ
jgi:hypothetical protein